MGKKLVPETVVFTGSARLPENVTGGHVYGVFSIDIEVDTASETIVDFACTLIPRLVEKVLSDSLVGYPFDEGIRSTIQELNKRFYSSTKRAMLAALEDADKWYQIYKRGVEK